MDHGASPQHAASECISSLGPLAVEYGTSRFTNSSVVIGDAVDVVMDDLVISARSNPLQIGGDIAVGDGVRTFLIDTVLEEDVDLIFPGFCRIDCHQVVDGNLSMIRQLVVDCNASWSGGDSV